MGNIAGKSGVIREDGLVGRETDNTDRRALATRRVRLFIKITIIELYDQLTRPTAEWLNGIQFEKSYAAHWPQ